MLLSPLPPLSGLLFIVGREHAGKRRQHKTEGIFTEHCVVIVEGKMQAGVFQVSDKKKRFRPFPSVPMFFVVVASKPVVIPWFAYARSFPLVLGQDETDQQNIPTFLLFLGRLSGPL